MLSQIVLCSKLTGRGHVLSGATAASGVARAVAGDLRGELGAGGDGPWPGRCRRDGPGLRLRDLEADRPAVVHDLQRPAVCQGVPVLGA